jgi:hypothetical protein
MSEADIDPEDELLMEGGRKPLADEEWNDADEEETSEREPTRLEEREQRQHAKQQHGDEFAVEG